MKRVVCDIETSGLELDSTIWCIVCKEEGSNTYLHWDITNNFEGFEDYTKTVDKWVFHNGIHFDVPVINHRFGTLIKLDQVIDTMVVSKLVNYSFYNGHGLNEIGISLGQPKTAFNDFSKYTPEMLQYCKDDVDLGTRIFNHYKRFIDDPSWAKSMECEHKTAYLCGQIQNNGFLFDLREAKSLLPQIKQRLTDLEKGMAEAWPPQLLPVHEIQYRLLGDGKPYKTVLNAMENYVKTEIDGDKLICYDWVSFNPGSSTQRVDKLWEAGWSPTEKTKSHYKFELKAQVGEPWGKKVLTQELYDEKKEQFSHYGWTVSEENLQTLPPDAPQGARDLSEWLCLNGRLKALEERIRECDEDSRIRAKFWHIGAWTHRMAHTNPNLANVSSPFHEEIRNPVDQVKSDYDAKFRRMFTVPEGSVLVGTDAESIQLRILAHYLKNEEYVEAIVNGRKEDGTDIHNLNRTALGLNHINRDDAKTFIYAWLLGAGNPKVSRILRCTVSQAKQSVDTFIERTKGLRKLKSGLILRDAERGYFEGLDGRKVICDSDYLMLAGYLQNGEAIAMKWWALDWIPKAQEEKINFKVVNFVHDEVQTEVNDSMDAAERLVEIQSQSMVDVGKRLNLFCPLSTESKIGTNWLETH